MSIKALEVQKRNLEHQIRDGDKTGMSASELQALEDELLKIEGAIFKLHKIESFGIGSRYAIAKVGDFKDHDVMTVIENKPGNLFEFAQKYVQDFMSVGYTGHSLVISGTNGVGKTHLACAIAIACREEFIRFHRTLEDFNIAFVTSADLSAHFVSRNFHADEEIKKYAQVNFLIIDDMGAEISDGEKGQWVNEQVINRVVRPRYNDCLPTIITTNAKFEAFNEMYGNRASSIFKGNTYTSIVMFSKKDLRSRNVDQG